MEKKRLISLFIVVVGICSAVLFISTSFSQNLLRKINTLLWTYEQPYHIEEVLISSDGNYVLLRNSNGHIYFFDNKGNLLWDSFGKRTTMTFGYLSGITRVSMSMDGKNIAAVSDNGMLNFLNKNGEVLWNHKIGHDYDVNRVPLCSPNGNYIAVVDNKRLLFFFNKNGEQLKINSIGNKKYRIIITPEEEYLTAEYLGNSINFYDTSGRIFFSGDTTYIKRLNSATSLDKRYTVECDAPRQDNWKYGKISLLNKERKLIFIHETNSWISSISISANGEYIVAGDAVGRLYFFRNPDISDTRSTYQNGAIPERDTL